MDEGRVGARHTDEGRMDEGRMGEGRMDESGLLIGNR